MKNDNARCHTGSNLENVWVLMDVTNDHQHNPSASGQVWYVQRINGRAPEGMFSSCILATTRKQVSYTSKTPISLSFAVLPISL